MRAFDTLAELAACVGQEVAVSDWHTVTQQAIDQFADATGDHQWIHVDPERAKTGPFGATIAHGFMTLSLLAGLVMRSLRIENVRMGVNYGLNRVRFTSPVPAGSRVRLRSELLEAAPIEGGMQLTWKNTIEREGADKPACVAEAVVRYYT
ncbi:MAG: MaoC family dehydratase [Ottowia sp.]|uniref:MaoC family dehydratase n=1 Tax=Ottowia sp. TaxID=1898956 RepID=UPI0039E657D6